MTDIWTGSLDEHGRSRLTPAEKAAVSAPLERRGDGGVLGLVIAFVAGVVAAVLAGIFWLVT